MSFFGSLAISLGGNILSGLFGGRRKRPTESPAEAMLRERSAQAIGRGMEQIEAITPLLRSIAEEDIRRYRSTFGAYQDAVSRIAKVLEQPFFPQMRESLGELETSRERTAEALLQGGVNPAVAEAISRAQMERNYYDLKERMRMMKLQQQLQAVNAIGSLLGNTSTPIGALTTVGQLASSLVGGGMGGLSNVAQTETQRQLAMEQVRMQREASWSNLFTTLGMLMGMQK